MVKQNKNSGPEARLPKGFRDIEADEIRVSQAMLATIREVYERYGFEPLETPALEYTDCLGKFLPDQDRPNAGVFSFSDEDDSERGLLRGANDERGLLRGANDERGLPRGANDERGLLRGANQTWMSLRYDLTAPLARYVAQNSATLPKPFRRYAVGSVFRNEKPGPGRFRQFTQFDADTVGTDNVAADAEMCMLAADTLEALGIARGDYVIKVNSRKVLDGVLELAGVDPVDPAQAGKRLTVLRAMDKFDKFGVEGVALLLGKGRKDESGDFTPGAGLEPKAIELVTSFLAASAGDRSGTIARVTPILDGNARAVDGMAELSQLDALVRSAGYESRQITFDPSVVRGLEYYTGPVFEAELTFQVKDDDGNPVRFGSVGGGGRYDDLVSRFTGEKVPATGFSIGVSRLQAALTVLGKSSAKATLGPVVVLVMDKAEIGAYQRLTQTLRNAGIRAEMYLGTSGMKAQMKYADKRNSPCVVIQGSDERAKGEVTLKDLIEGAKAASAIKDNKEWKDARPAQVAVKEADLVAEVRAILARHEG
ncbi:MAG: histidine--tRNA ligase [Hyphomicrobium sp.]|nr:histidine--tRNA ligase [Hyphomicrobium sp.]PPC84116.1 MAG: histidine--tRNA ligase [Hyphomicrobium sp.]